jgi:UDP-2,4-diacetamido-2,4,6-trideoxy-beta-L-altropyranose hydrolase
MKPVVLRADADARLGAGHLMRCLAIAHALRGQAEPIIATTCREAALLEHVHSAGVPVHRLEAAYPDARDAAAVASLVRGAQALVVDGYHFDNEYLDAVGDSGVRTMMVDDAVRLRRYDADMLLDVNLGALRQRYTLRSGALALLGARFTLLRPQFLEAARSAAPVPQVASRVLVTLGASDPPNATARVLTALARDAASWDVTVVLGGANPHVESVEAAASALPRVRVCRNVAAPEVLMADADIAIGAVGGTMWELAHLGVPTLLVSTSELHDRVAAMAHAYGAHEWLGNVGDLDDRSIADAAHTLARDQHRRARMTRLGQALIDGKGAARVAAALCSPRGAPWVRPAVPVDAEAIWEMSSTGGETQTPFADFEGGFQARINDPQSRPWVTDTFGSAVAFVDAGPGSTAGERRQGVAAALKVHGMLEHLAATVEQVYQRQ